MNIALETPDRNIELFHAASGGITGITAYPALWQFKSMYRAAAPIDVASVTAVIVDGVRLPLE